MRKILRFNKKILISDLKVWTPAIVIYLLYHFFAIKLFRASCPLILLFGIPCPGCGMTRAIRMVLTLQFEKAYFLNPLAFLWVPFLLYVLFTRYFYRENKRITYILLSILIILTFARYFYGMISYYPNRIPYVYTSRNLTHYMWSYRQ